jgi:hypothetical protein
MIKYAQGKPAGLGTLQRIGHGSGDYRFIAVFAEQDTHHIPGILIVINAENPFSCS